MGLDAVWYPAAGRLEGAPRPVREEAGDVISCFEGSTQKTFGQGRVQVNVIMVDGKYGIR